jgi:hypothetical protein
MEVSMASSALAQSSVVPKIPRIPRLSVLAGYVCPYCGKSRHEPNAQTRAALREAQQVEDDSNAKAYSNIDELFADLHETCMK